MIYTVALILTSVMDIPMSTTIIIIGVVTLIYSYRSKPSPTFIFCQGFINGSQNTTL